MDLQSVVTVLSLLVGVIGIFLQYRQIQLMQTASPKRTTSKLWWRMPVVVALATLTVLNLSVLGIAIWLRPPAATLSVSSWGGLGLPEGKALFITALSAQDDPTHRMMAVAYHYAGDVDPHDLKDLQKSALFDIRKGAQTMIIKLDDKFINEANSGKHVVANYSLLIMPRSVERDDVTTLRRLRELGGTIIATMVGAP